MRTGLPDVEDEEPTWWVERDEDDEFIVELRIRDADGTVEVVGASNVPGRYELTRTGL